MEEGFQIGFNIVAVSLIYVFTLVASYRSKLAKSKRPDKDAPKLLGETLGVGVMLLFLIFGVFAVGYWGG